MSGKGAAGWRPRSRAFLGALLAVGLLSVAYVAFGVREKRARGFNVLLVTIDTLRADALGCYGNPRVETPTIDRLAAGGVRFERAHAHNVLTLPSHCNILTGRYPFDHGVRDNSGFRLPSTVPTLATLLREQGYRTGAFVSAFPLDARFGLNRGFDTYDDRLGDPEANPAFHMEERGSAETVASATRWISSSSTKPFFCWVHVYDPHAPYEPPEPWASKFREDPYHGEVSAADSFLSPLLEPILKLGPKGRTLVVLTADHGESLGEHGEETHGIFAYEPTLRVPLIVYAPAVFEPRVVRDGVRHVDILPTILELLGLPGVPGLPGESLLGIASGRAERGARPSYFESLAPTLTRGWAPLYGMLLGDEKYIELPLPELYDLAQDPREATNKVEASPEVVARMRSLLPSGRELGAITAPRETPEVVERLRSLGYTSSGTGAPTKARYTEDDDPKRLIALSASIDEVWRLYHEGDVERARVLCEDLVRKRPMDIVLQHLAYLRRARGDLAGAVDAARRALALNSADTVAAATLGAYLNESSRSREAEEVLRPYATASDPDVDVLFAYGAAQAQDGERAEALATLGRARVLDPTNAMALVNIGTVQLMEKDYGAAKASFEQALTLEPRLSRAYNSLGIIAAEGGRPDEAIALWKKAVAINPTEYDTLFNLGDFLVRQGRRAEARSFFEMFEKRAPDALYARDLAWIRKWLAADGARRDPTNP
jgi:arylsulfatase A-like enzyme/tetratricopeptide (TPR) repeat protein